MSTETQERTKIGFTVVAQESLGLEQANADSQAILRQLQAMDVEVVRFPGLVQEVSQAQAAAKMFNEKGIDLLLIQMGTWVLDDLIIPVAQNVPTPLILWATLQHLTGEFPTGATLTGLTQTGGTLAKIGREFEALYGSPDDEAALKRIALKLRVIGVRKKLRRARIGLVGAHAPGMTDATFHELELRNAIGPQVCRVELVAFLRLLEKVSDDEATTFVEKEMTKVGRVAEPTKGQMVEAAKIYLALRNLVESESLDALAMRCWPELREFGFCSPCFALSRLSDDGTMAACEGDVTAAVSMLILQELSGHPAYLGDVLSIDREENVVYEFHCGAAASQLAADEAQIELRTHGEKRALTWKPGVTVEFSIAPGRVTYARLGEVKGVYRLLITGGESLETERFSRGNIAKVRLDSDVWQVVERAIAEGHEHHYILAPADVREELVELAKLMGIRTVIL